MDKYNIIQEYIESVYDNFDTSIINFPTGAGAMNHLLRIIANRLQETKQTTLILTRNSMMQEYLYQDFCNELDLFSGKNGVNPFYEFENGSTIFFKLYNKLEYPTFNYSGNVVFFNIDLKRNNKPTLEILDKINTCDKKLFINCNIRNGVETVIARKLKGKIYQKECNYDVSDLPMEIRKFKLKKIREKYHE